MEKITINDKSQILGINLIEGKYIKSQTRKVIVFEYFSNFQKSFMFEMLENLGFEFQVKIRKESFKENLEEFKNADYIDLDHLREKNHGEFSIILEEDKESELKTKKIDEENLLEFISEEKGGLYIYRHYVIISIPEKENTQKIIYNFISQIKETNNIIRILKEKDLEKYLRNEIFEEKEIGYTEKGNSDGGLLSNILNGPSVFSYQLIKKLNGLTNLIENSFFQNNIENIDSKLLDILSSSTYKFNDYIRIGKNFKGGLFFKGIPKDNFNILNFLFTYLEKGDSITINIYSKNKHQEEEKVKTGIETLIKEEKSNEEEKVYLQLLINISDINNIMLNKKIDNFQSIIGEDIYTQRLTGVMSNYFATYIGTGENKLHLERLYNKERLINNLIF